MAPLNRIGTRAPCMVKIDHTADYPDQV